MLEKKTTQCLTFTFIWWCSFYFTKLSVYLISPTGSLLVGFDL